MRRRRAREPNRARSGTIHGAAIVACSAGSAWLGRPVDAVAPQALPGRTESNL